MITIKHTDIKHFLQDRGVKHIVLLKIQNASNPILGVVMLCFRKHFDDEKWDHILSYVSSHLYSVFSTINYIDRINSPLEDSSIHSLYYDADTILENAKQINRGYDTLGRDIDLIKSVIENKFITDQLLTLSVRNSSFNLDDFQQAKDNLFHIKNNFVIKKDAIIKLAESIKQRSSIVGFDNLSVEDQKLLRKLNAEIGDRGIVEKIISHKDMNFIALKTIIDGIARPLIASLKVKSCYMRILLNPNIMVKSNKFLANIVIKNIITNATKYAIDHSVIDIEYNITSYNTLELIVSNDAPCLSYREQTKMISKGFRGNTNSKEVGAGLGLFEVNKLIRHSKALNISSLSYTVDNNSTDCKYRFILTFKDHKLE